MTSSLNGFINDSNADALIVIAKGLEHYCINAKTCLQFCHSQMLDHVIKSVERSLGTRKRKLKKGEESKSKKQRTSSSSSESSDEDSSEDSD